MGGRYAVGLAFWVAIQINHVLYNKPVKTLRRKQSMHLNLALLAIYGVSVLVNLGVLAVLILRWRAGRILGSGALLRVFHGAIYPGYKFGYFTLRKPVHSDVLYAVACSCIPVHATLLAGYFLATLATEALRSAAASASNWLARPV